MKLNYFFIATICLLTLFACGSDESTESSDSSNKEDDTNDTLASDTANSEYLVSDEIVDMDSIELDVKNASSIEKAATGVEGRSEAASAVFKTYDLSEFGFNITISIPEGSEIELNDLDEAVIKYKDDFILEVGENYDGMPEEVKKMFKGNMHNQMLGYVIEDANGFVRKIKSNGIVSHNLFYTTNDGTMDLTVKSPMGQAYSQEEILVMWKACQTLKKK